MAAWKVFGAKGMEDAMDGEEKAIRLPSGDNASALQGRGNQG